MDKRDLAAGFRERFRQIVAAETDGLSGFISDIGIDRSALSQFLDPRHDRLPRAETLRRIAEARGVSVDWLLCLENAPEGRQTLSTSYQIESASAEDGSSPLDRWHGEAEGHKIRYVPSRLPDMLEMPKPSGQNGQDIPLKNSETENVLSGLDHEDRDIEVAMPIQVIEDLAQQRGLWRAAPAELCKAQLEFMARTCADHYPALRVHLYDGAQVFSAPFTVFGKLRAALYVGESYLVITAPEQVRAFVRRFDFLVRQSIVNPDVVHETFTQLASEIRGQGPGHETAPTK